MADIVDPFDTTTSTTADSGNSSAGIVDPFDSSTPSTTSKAPRTWTDTLTDPVTDIGPEIAHEASDAWNAAKEGLTAPPKPGVTGALENLWDTTKGLANAARIPAAPITGTARSLIGHPMADLEQAVGENVVTPAMEYLTGKKRSTPLPTNDQLYEQSKKDIDTALSALPASRVAPTVPAAPTIPHDPFGVTLTEGERTGDLAARQAEQAALRGQSGTSAQEHAQQFMNEQRPQQLEAARENVSQSLDPTGNQTLASTPAEAAEFAQNSLQQENARQKSVVKSLYDKAKSLPGEINSNVFTGMPQDIKTSLTNRPESVIIDDNTPVASRMINYLDNQIGQLRIKNLAQPQSTSLAALGPAPIVGVNLEGIEQWRKNLSRMRGDALAAYGTNPSDSRAANAVINEFDKRIGDAVNSGAFTGDPAAVQAFNDARAAHSARMQLWGNDAIGRRLQSIIGDAATGRDPASLNDVSNYLYSASGTSPNSLNIGVAKRIKKILGEDSPEWAAIRQGMFHRLVSTPEGVPDRGPAAVANRISEFLNGKGSDMAPVLFTPEQRSMLQQYANLHRTLSVPLQGANWSNTAAGVIPHIKTAGNKLIGMVGALLGEHISPVIGSVVGYAAGDRFSRLLEASQHAKEARKIAQQMPIAAQQFRAWQSAVRQHARTASLTNAQRLSISAASLANTLGKMGINQSVAMRLLTSNPPEGPGTSEAKERSSGGVAAFADGGVPTFDERFTGTTDDDPSPDDMVDTVANAQPPATSSSTSSWQDEEARSNLAALESANPPQDDESFWSKAMDAAQRFAGYTGKFASDVAGFPQWAYEHPEELKANAEKLIGEQALSRPSTTTEQVLGSTPIIGPGLELASRGATALEDPSRYQTWPEKTLRSGLSLAKEAMTGDVPQWSEDPTTGEVHTSPQMIERAQDMAALGGSGGLAGVEATGADATFGSAPFLRPALKYEGKIYKAPIGGQHLEALPPDLRNTYMRQALNGDDISNFDFGFMNHKGQFLNREDALDYAVNNGLADPQNSKYRVLTTDFLDNNTHPDLQKAYDKLATTSDQAPSLRPAIKTSDGKVYAGNLGEDHWAVQAQDVPKSMRDDWRNLSGYVDENGNFLNRGEGLQYALKHDLIDTKQWPSTPKDFLPSEYLKSYTALSDTNKAGAPLSALERADPFYSAVEKTIQAAPQTKMQGVQWANWLKNQPGVKPDELEWTGVDNWLRDQKGPVTKDQVQNYMDQNKVQVQDAVKQDPERFQKRLEELENSEAARQGRVGPELDEYDRLIQERSKTNPTRYQNWQLPGGENYREHLLTLPDRQNNISTVAEQLFNKTPKQLSDAELSAAESWLSKNRDLGGNYNSRHWDEPNVLAHIRSNERDVEGVPSLHLEELQSDWHQQGRKQGYKLSNPENDELNKLSRERERGNGLNDSDENRFNELNSRARGIIPNAPFKTSWPELALKRMIQLAAQEGKSRISWTPGEAQAARYDLSKHFDEIKAWKNPDGTYKLTGVRTNANRNDHTIGDDIPKSKLADSVGKELAEKIINQPDSFGQYKGLDLKVGGEGMKGFYDKMLPKMVEKLGKQYGVKVKRASVETSQFRDQNGNILTPVPQDVYYFDIPEKMKQDVLTKGQALFSDTSDPGAALSGLEQSKVVNLGDLREQKALGKFHKGLMSDIANRARERAQLAREYHETGKLPFPVGTRFSTEHSRRQGLAPLEITGHYVDSKDPEKYGYYYNRGPEEERESGVALVNDPKRPEVAELSKQFSPFTGVQKPGTGNKAAVDTRSQNILKNAASQVGQQRNEAFVSLQNKAFNELSTFVDSMNKKYENPSDWSPFEKRKYQQLKDKLNKLKPGDEKRFASGGEVRTHKQEEYVSRPVQHQKDEGEINVPERASGGRVVASNINHSPSEAQKHAGNYAKEHIRAHGLDFTIENAKGKERSGIGKDGKRWRVKLPAHYGYIKRTKGADGDHVDVYMGPHIKSKDVYVVNQVDADSKKFDEHKVILGMRNLEHALKTYENGFSDGRGLERIGSIVPTTMTTFKHWLEHGDTKKPFRLN